MEKVQAESPFGGKYEPSINGQSMDIIIKVPNSISTESKNMML
ncbi:hypothetical protein QOZ84_14590 [Romboutsia sedimentorum]|uniref:Uncharacterized protein n=1 Tax=Romboutsia sedimentorum TaxID=1368474 RepID=A0ABT7ECW9_9FIRM|nr:hypothetical protein [Romboutsia sedimentorum]MDK2564761.1 hypothetical protein [Romboutsia sedimentorum]